MDNFDKQFAKDQAAFKIELDEKLAELDAQRQKTISDHNKEVAILLKKINDSTKAEEDKFNSTSESKRKEFVNLVADLDKKRKQIILEQAEKNKKALANFINEVDDKSQELIKQEAKLEDVLKNADEIVEENEREYDRMVKDTSIFKIARESPQTVSTAMYGLGLIALILLIILITKKPKRK
jgi:hypothetical protein